MKQILILNWWDIKNPKAGGAEVHLQEIFSRLAKKDYRVTLICSTFPGSKRKEIIDDINIFRIAPWWLINLVSAFWYLRNRANFDFVIDYTNKIPYLTPLYVKDKPLIAVAHHVFGEIWLKEWGFIGRFFRSFERFFYRFYRKTPIIAVSQSTKKELVDIGLYPRNIQVIYNGISAPARKGAKSKKPLIVYLGRLKRYKRIDWVLTVMPNLIKTSPNIQFLIMGRGNDSDRLRGIVKTKKIQSHVKFLGFVGEEKKFVILRKAWVNIQPSIKEGWGFTVLEAAASGTLSIVGNVPGIRETIINHKTGCYFRGQKGLKKVIAELVSNRSLCIKMGMAAKKFSQNFDWDKSVSDVEKLLVLINH